MRNSISKWEISSFPNSSSLCLSEHCVCHNTVLFTQPVVITVTDTVFYVLRYRLLNRFSRTRRAILNIWGIINLSIDSERVLPSFRSSSIKSNLWVEYRCLKKEVLDEVTRLRLQGKTPKSLVDRQVTWTKVVRHIKWWY